MRRSYVHSGMTLLEILVVLATVIILAGALIGLGKHIVQRADIDLTESALEVIATALEQYYSDHDDFPFVTLKDITGDDVDDPYSQDNLEYDLIGTVVDESGGAFTLNPDQASSAELFYYLDQNSNSRKIISALNVSLISSDVGGTHVMFEFDPTAGGETIDLPWFVDSWGTVIRYEYLPETAFPILTSAGPDKTFGTADDIKK